MQILVKTVNGKSMTLEVESSETIDYIKVKMQRDENNQVEERHATVYDREKHVHDVHTTPDDRFRIFVKTLTGKRCPLRVSGSNTIGELKCMMEEKEGYPVDHQRFIFAGRQLENEPTLGDCGIQKEDTIDLVLRLCGC